MRPISSRDTAGRSNLSGSRPPAVARGSLLGPARRWLPGGSPDRGIASSGVSVCGGPAVRRVARTEGRAWPGRDASRRGWFLDAIDEQICVVVNGAGIITDAFQESALGILATLELACGRGVPDRALRSGLGPIADAETAAARRRGPAACGAHRRARIPDGFPLLDGLGVGPARVQVTGDDAIELAFAAHQRRRGDDPTGLKSASTCGWRPMRTCRAEMLSGHAGRWPRRRASYSAGVPIPIAHHGGRMDVETLRDLLDGQDRRRRGADTPQHVIDRVGECRIIVTGSYHGAVFALAQGIPVVALANSSTTSTRWPASPTSSASGARSCASTRMTWPAAFEHRDQSRLG